MPDWAVHITFAFALALLLKIKRKEIFILGALIPDIVRLIDLLAISLDQETLFLLGIGFHSPTMGLLLSGIIATTLFRNSDWKNAWVLLFGGALTHLFLDAMMLYTVGGVRLLWPLSFERLMALELFPSQSLLPLGISLVVWAGYLSVRYLKTRDVRKTLSLGK